MESVYKGLRAIIIFVIMMLIISTVLNDKAAEKFGMFLLFSMLILNADSFAKITSAVTGILKDPNTV